MILTDEEIMAIPPMHSNGGQLAYARKIESAILAKQREQLKLIFAFRRRGLFDFCTCTKERYDELAQKPHIFEVAIFYTKPGL